MGTHLLRDHGGASAGETLRVGNEEGHVAGVGDVLEGNEVLRSSFGSDLRSVTGPFESIPFSLVSERQPDDVEHTCCASERVDACGIYIFISTPCDLRGNKAVDHCSRAQRSGVTSFCPLSPGYAHGPDIAEIFQCFLEVFCRNIVRQIVGYVSVKLQRKCPAELVPLHLLPSG